MSRRYAPDHKALVRRILADFKGDVIAASRYPGVPERTLREWYAQWRAAAARERAAERKAQSPQRQPPPGQSPRQSPSGG